MIQIQTQTSIPRHGCSESGELKEETVHHEEFTDLLMVWCSSEFLRTTARWIGTSCHSYMKPLTLSDAPAILLEYYLRKSQRTDQRRTVV